MHLTFTGGSAHLVAEFSAARKQAIDKEKLAPLRHSENVSLTTDELSILQRWLSIRYRRSAFADEFDRRMKNGPNKFYEKFAKIISRTEEHLLVVYFQVDPSEHEEQPGPEDTYSLSISLVYNVMVDPENAKAAAIAAAAKIKDLFTKSFQHDGKWAQIELVDVDAISEAAITIHQARLLQPWQFEYLSLRETPPSDISQALD